MPPLIALTLLTGLPALAPFEPPLALFSVEVVQDGPSAVAEGLDSLVPYGAGRCQSRSLSTLRVLGGGLSMVERTLAWLGRNPGVEEKLYGRTGALGEVMTHVSKSAIVPKRACAAPMLADGWRWTVERAPKLCPVAPGAETSERWLVNAGVPAAAVVVRPSADPCQARVSVAMFDGKGRTRVLLHADFGGAMAATLVGPSCRVELVWDEAARVFAPAWKSCKA